MRGKQVIIHTDGACWPNPGAGAWAAILQYTDLENKTHTLELSAYRKKTTNNIMELTGVLKALQALKKPCHVHVYSDSQYVVLSLGHWHKGQPTKTKAGRIVQWIANGWRRKEQPLKNKQLWKQVLVIVKKQLTFKITWIRGHSGHLLNERADALANQALTHAPSTRIKHNRQWN